MIKVKKLIKHAMIPTKNNRYDAGWDLYAAEDVTINAGEQALISTGIALEMPNEYCGLIWSRSGLAVKQGIQVMAGVIDSSYRGEIKVCYQRSPSCS